MLASSVQLINHISCTDVQPELKSANKYHKLLIFQYLIQLYLLGQSSGHLKKHPSDAA